MKVWLQVLLIAWRERRGDEGGVSDDVAMMGLMLAVAIAVAGVLLGVITGAASRLDFGF